VDKDLAETLTNPDNLFAAIVAVAAFATFIGIAMPSSRAAAWKRALSRWPIAARSSSADRVRPWSRRPARLAEADRRGLYKGVVERLHLRRLLEDTSVQDKLAQAGFRGPRPISTYYFFRFLTPLILAPLTALYLLADQRLRPADDGQALRLHGGDDGRVLCAEHLHRQYRHQAANLDHAVVSRLPRPAADLR